MRLREILIERGETYFDAAGRVHFKTHDAYLKAKNSDWDKMRLAAQDWSTRNPPVGEFWPKDWNASPQGDRNNSELRTANTNFGTILDPNRGGLSTATLGRPEPDIDIGTVVAGTEIEPKPKPTMPMGGIAGVIRRKQQK